MEKLKTTLRHWVLNPDTKQPEEMFDMIAWSRSPQAFPSIKREEFGEVLVSTIFHGLGSCFTGLPFFETMIFGGPLDMYQERCATYEEALEQHALAVKLHQESLTSRRIKDADQS